MEERLEEKSLLVNKTATTDIKLYFPKWLAYTFLACITFLHMMSYVLSLYVTGEYTYVYFLEEKYPGAPHSLSGSLATCAINKSSIEYKVQTEIQKISAEWGIYTNLAFIIPSLLLNINLATYSDVHGRKLFFIVPLVGTVLKNIMCGVGMYYNINARLMLIFYMIEACTGTWVATLCMSFCFIADTTKPGKRRSIVIAVVEGGIGFGSLIAQFISGYTITGTNGFFYPQIIAAALALIPLVIVLLFIEETLPESKKRTHVSIIQNMKRVLECYKPNFSQYGKRWMFVVLLLMFIMSVSANLSRGNVEYLYQIASPFCWDSVTIGVYGAIRTSFWNIGSILMIAVFQLFTSDAVIALLGCVTTIANLIVEGLAQTDTMLYICMYILTCAHTKLSILISIK